MLETIILVLVALWLIGVLAHIGGALINLLLLIALVVIAYRAFTGRQA